MATAKRTAGAKTAGRKGRPVSARTEGYTKEFLDRALYLLLLNRAFDDRVSTLYRQNQVKGAAFSSRGQEAISVGSVLALRDEDVIGPMIRNSGAILAKGLPPAEFLANYLARATGPTRGRDGNTHLGSLRHGILAPISMLGALIPVCCGAALAFRMRGEARVALTWIGDGGASTGDFHEGLNLAATLRLGVVLILENNQWAYSTPVARQTAQTDFLKRAEAYGVPGLEVDGNDLIAVFEAARMAGERARAGDGPTLIVARTYRMKGHAEHDDFSYMPKAELEEWRGRDPILRFEALLLSEERMTREEIETTRERAVSEMVQAESAALAAPLPEAGDGIRGVYADS